MMLWAIARETLRQQCTLLALHQQKHTRSAASTVFALSSGQGKCGVAVVRVSGEQANTALTNMTIPSTLPRPRTAVLRRIVHPTTREVLDRGLVLWFPEPHSFTGENSCELHIHGGPAVIAAVLTALGTLPGYIPAQPGDFTKRAFYQGKLDLTSVEGLGDLIHAETEAQRKQALRQMEGALAHLYTGWRQSLLQCRANLEAYIDFSEDENIEDGVVHTVETKLHQLVKELEQHLADNRRGERLRSGLHMAILGKPNVGKSSLLNALTQRPAAIVSPIPGTTRDVVETVIDLGGYPVILSDTAGLRKTADPVEAEGVSRALTRASQADLALVVLEAPDVLSALRSERFKWNDFLRSHLIGLGIIEEDRSKPEWLENQYFVTVINKIDLIEEQDRALMENIIETCSLLSLRTEEGFKEFLEKLMDLCGSLCDAGTVDNPTLTDARHRTHISACLEALKRVLEPDDKEHISGTSGSLTPLHIEEPEEKPVKGVNLLQSENTIVIAAHLLQQAATSLGHVTGHITSEDVLDHIFSAFCIGK